MGDDLPSQSHAIIFQLFRIQDMAYICKYVALHKLPIFLSLKMCQLKAVGRYLPQHNIIALRLDNK